MIKIKQIPKYKDQNGILYLNNMTTSFLKKKKEKKSQIHKPLLK